MLTINCRAKISHICDHGKPTKDGGYHTDNDYTDDGTYNGESIICDSCYIKLGQPSVPVSQAHRRAEVLDKAIADYKENN